MKVVIDCGLDGLTFTKPSLTKPQFADDCDLSVIVRRFLRTGQLPDTPSRPQIDDATEMSPDFFEALEPAVKAQQQFDLLPLEVRNRFNNDALLWFEEAVKAAGDKPADKPAEPPVDKPGQPSVDKPGQPSVDKPGEPA